MQGRAGQREPLAAPKLTSGSTPAAGLASQSSSQLRSPRLSATFHGVTTRAALEAERLEVGVSEDVRPALVPEADGHGGGRGRGGTRGRREGEQDCQERELASHEVIQSMLRRSAEDLESLDPPP